MKKVLAAALFCAVSSFAQWDLFPAKEAGKGEAKVGVQYGIIGDASSFGLNLGARFSIIEGLEASLRLNGTAGGFVVMQDPNEDATGLAQPTIGVRYWLPMGLGFYVDAALPFGSEDLLGTDSPNTGLNAGVQFSTKINDQLSIGSKAGIETSFGDADAGIDLAIAAEVDYSLGSITPWLALDVTTGLAGAGDADPSEMGLGVEIGVGYDISDAIYVNAGAWFGAVGDRFGDDMPISIFANFGLNF